MKELASCVELSKAMTNFNSICLGWMEQFFSLISDTFILILLGGIAFDLISEVRYDSKTRARRTTIALASKISLTNINTWNNNFVNTCKCNIKCV